MSCSSSAARSGDGVGAAGDHEIDERCRFGLELVGTSDEVGFALEQHDRADVAVDLDRHDALVVVAVVTLGAGGQALLAEQLLGGIDVAIGLLERLLAVHHARAGCVAEGLHVLCGE